MQYTCLSKWIVYLIFIYLEPIIIYTLNFIPFIAIVSTFVKYRILSLDSNFHLTIYDRFLYHLSDYDVFSYLVNKSAGFFVKITEIGIKLVLKVVISRDGIEEDNQALDEFKKVLINAVNSIE
jgi:hypothetical protein